MSDHFSKNSLLLNVNMAKIWFTVKFIRHLFLHIRGLHNRRFWSKTLGCFEARFDISILLVYHFWIAWKALKEVSKSSQKYMVCERLYFWGLKRVKISVFHSKATLNWKSPLVSPCMYSRNCYTGCSAHVCNL